MDFYVFKFGDIQQLVEKLGGQAIPPHQLRNELRSYEESFITRQNTLIDEGLMEGSEFVKPRESPTAKFYESSFVHSFFKNRTEWLSLKTQVDEDTIKTIVAKNDFLVVDKRTTEARLSDAESQIRQMRFELDELKRLIEQSK